MEGAVLHAVCGRGPLEAHRKALVELELQEVVSCSMLVVGTEPGSSRKGVRANY